MASYLLTCRCSLEAYIRERMETDPSKNSNLKALRFKFHFSLL